MANNYTRENYITINGKRYYTGTVFIIDFLGKRQEASFVFRVVTDLSDVCLCKVGDKRWFINTEQLKTILVSIADKIDTSVHMPIEKTMQDRYIDGLFIGWLWYIFLMGISVIFKDAIGLWVLISVIFFSWRNKKIKEEGTYIEW